MTTVIILVALLLALLAGGLYLMYSPGGGRGRGDSGTPSDGIPHSSLVTVRNAVQSAPLDGGEDGGSFDDGGFPLYYESEAYEERTKLEIFQDPDTPPETRAAIADELRMMGYTLGGRFAGIGSGTSAPADPAGHDDFAGLSEEYDVRVLRARLDNPFIDPAMRDAVGRRLAELGEPGYGGGGEESARHGGTYAPPAVPGPEPFADTFAHDAFVPGYGDGYGDGEGDGPDVSGFVDPSTLMSVDLPGSVYDGGEDPGAMDGGFTDPLAGIGGEGVALTPDTVPAPSADPYAHVDADGPGSSDGSASAPAGDLAEDGGMAPVVDEDPGPGFVCPPCFEPDPEPGDDGGSSEMAVRLMTFIARSFRDGLIEPELVAFAQERLNLEVAGGLWDDSRRLRARQRVAVYERDPVFEAMSLDEFDLHVRDVVEANRRERDSVMDPGAAGDVPAPGGSAEGPVPAEEPGPASAVREAATAVHGPSPTPKGETSLKGERVRPGRPVTGRTRAATVFFDAHGGKDDLLWHRLEGGR